MEQAKNETVSQKVKTSVQDELAKEVGVWARQAARYAGIKLIQYMTGSDANENEYVDVDDDPGVRRQG